MFAAFNHTKHFITYDHNTTKQIYVGKRQSPFKANRSQEGRNAGRKGAKNATFKSCIIHCSQGLVYSFIGHFNFIYRLTMTNKYHITDAAGGYLARAEDGSDFQPDVNKAYLLNYRTARKWAAYLNRIDSEYRAKVQRATNQGIIFNN